MESAALIAFARREVAQLELASFDELFDVARCRAKRQNGGLPAQHLFFK